MKDPYPTYEEYIKLYPRYLNRNPANLLEGIDFAGKVCLDICCGGGRATREMLNKGAAKVYALDQSPEMMSPLLNGGLLKPYHPNRYTTLIKDVETYLVASNLDDYFDVITCQQGINYWFEDYLAEYIHKALRKNGVFIFNTFNTKPPEHPTIKHYSIDDVEYVEVAYCIDNVVYHSQHATGCRPHHTEFKWISPDDFSRFLEFFDIHVITDKNTAIWTCRKKDYE